MHQEFNPGQPVEVQVVWAYDINGPLHTWISGHEFVRKGEIRGNAFYVVKKTAGTFKDCEQNFLPENVRSL